MIGPKGGLAMQDDGIVPLAAAEIFRGVAKLEAEEPSCQHRLSTSMPPRCCFLVVLYSCLLILINEESAVVQQRKFKESRSASFVSCHWPTQSWRASTLSH